MHSSIGAGAGTKRQNKDALTDNYDEEDLVVRQQQQQQQEEEEQLSLFLSPSLINLTPLFRLACMCK